MMRRGFSILLCGAALALPMAGQTYCAAAKTNACSGTLYEFISGVTLPGLANPSGCTITPAYTDYTALPGASLLTGGLNPVAVTVSNYWSTDAVDLYADWNGNGVFTDAGELTTILDPGGVPSGTGQINTFNANLTPPVGAVASTRLRFVLRYGGAPNSCPTTAITYGEIEDYTIGTYVGVIPCILQFTAPIGPGSLLMENTDCASVANADYMIAITLAPGLFPNGWFFGLDIAYPDLINEFNTGFPFTGTLSGTGASTFLLPGGVPSGLQIWAVSANFTPGFGVLMYARAPVAYVTP
jgi:GEVED domain